MATKHDLAQLEARLTKEFAMVRLEFESLEHKLRADFAHDMRGWFFALGATFTVLLALATTASRLVGT